MEEDIALFMKHCIFLRIPKTRQKLREDILHFVQYKQLQTPRMAEDGPGKLKATFIEFCLEATVKFLTDCQLVHARVTHDVSLINVITATPSIL